MPDLPLMAATEWVRSNSTTERDPVVFGHKVAQVYLAAQATRHHSGNEQATAAALAALSVPAIDTNSAQDGQELKAILAFPQERPVSDCVTLRDLEQAGVFARSGAVAHPDRLARSVLSAEPAISTPRSSWLTRLLAGPPTVLQWIRRWWSRLPEGADK